MAKNFLLPKVDSRAYVHEDYQSSSGSSSHRSSVVAFAPYLEDCDPIKFRTPTHSHQSIDVDLAASHIPRFAKTTTGSEPISAITIMENLRLERRLEALNDASVKVVKGKSRRTSTLTSRRSSQFETYDIVKESQERIRKLIDPDQSNILKVITDSKIHRMRLKEGVAAYIRIPCRDKKLPIHVEFPHRTGQLETCLSTKDPEPSATSRDFVSKKHAFAWKPSNHKGFVFNIDMIYLGISSPASLEVEFEIQIYFGSDMRKKINFDPERALHNQKRSKKLTEYQSEVMQLQKNPVYQTEFMREIAEIRRERAIRVRSLALDNRNILRENIENLQTLASPSERARNSQVERTIKQHIAMAKRKQQEDERQLRHLLNLFKREILVEEDKINREMLEEIGLKENFEMKWLCVIQAVQAAQMIRERFQRKKQMILDHERRVFAAKRIRRAWYRYLQTTGLSKVERILSHSLIATRIRCLHHRKHKKAESKALLAVFFREHLKTENRISRFMHFHSLVLRVEVFWIRAREVFRMRWQSLINLWNKHLERLLNESLTKKPSRVIKTKKKKSQFEALQDITEDMRDRILDSYMRRKKKNYKDKMAEYHKKLSELPDKVRKAIKVAAAFDSLFTKDKDPKSTKAKMLVYNDEHGLEEVENIPNGEELQEGHGEDDGVSGEGAENGENGLKSGGRSSVTYEVPRPPDFKYLPRGKVMRDLIEHAAKIAAG